MTNIVVKRGTRKPGFQNIDSNTLVLFFNDEWNDFGYSVNFNAYCINNKVPEVIGKYRIFKKKIVDGAQEKDWNNTDFEKNTYDEFLRETSIELNNFSIFDKKDYFSIAAEESFYENLYKKFGDDYKEILAKLRDASTNFSEDEFGKVLEAKRENTDFGNFSFDIYDSVLFRSDYSVRDMFELIKILKDIDKSELDLCTYPGKILRSGQYQRKFREKFDLDYYSTLVRIVYSYIELVKKNNQKDNMFDFCEKLLNEYEIRFRRNVDSLKSDLLASKDENLKQIFEETNNIKKLLKYPLFLDLEKGGTRNSSEFVHYTSMDSLRFLIRKNEYGKDKMEKKAPLQRLSNARQMNDPREGRVLFDLLESDIDKLNEGDYSASPYYFASMAGLENDNKINDNLSMWNMYAGDADGICLTYSKSYIANLAKIGIAIYKVVYCNGSIDDISIKSDGIIKNISVDELKKSLNKIKEALNVMFPDPLNQVDQRNKNIVLSLLDPIRYLFKVDNYSYENEYRMLVNYEGHDNELIIDESQTPPRVYAYIKDEFLEYSEVKFGPNAQNIDFIAPYIKHIDNKIKVTESNIPYRTSR